MGAIGFSIEGPLARLSLQIRQLTASVRDERSDVEIERSVGLSVAS